MSIHYGKKQIDSLFSVSQYMIFGNHLMIENLRTAKTLSFFNKNWYMELSKPLMIAPSAAIPVSSHKTTAQDRYSWKEGSDVEVYLRMKDRWVSAKITNVFIDKDGEWLTINVMNKAIFELSRLDEMLRRLKTPEEIQAEIEEQKRQERERHKKGRKIGLIHEKSAKNSKICIYV
ncbi:hypothetical protein RFI_14208 [Reticulomyxa filosa]|uniref:Uncharacterized protein n=1 Tax=Reticulomyxa filosa TaxID=46433 RepID=X6N9L6_RETFI|nr:hypothetical protein RFI_14208 [Reticulomyxa filosa]|eukprot:ETO22980.1 hypothetical protein RFI_14208 [Reticulomyxa filosa]